MILSGFLTLVASCGIEEIIDPVRNRVVTLATQQQEIDLDVVPNSYMVMFKTQRPTLSLRFASFLTEYKHHYSWMLARFVADSRIVDVDYITTVDLSNPSGSSFSPDFDVPRTLQLAWNGSSNSALMGSLSTVNFRNPESAKSLLQEWTSKGLIWYAEPNYNNRLIDIFGDAKTNYEAAGIWWHQSINLYNAYETLSAREIPPHPADADISPPVIAVLDSGLDVSNPLLADRVWVNSAPGQSGCAGDVNGCNTTNGSKGTLGTGSVAPFAVQSDGTCAGGGMGGACGHGTHVSGIIAAQLDGQVGGVCPVCKIMTIRIIKDDGKGGGKAPDAAILRGMKYLTIFKESGDAAVRIVNSSFGKYNRSRSVAVLVSVLKRKPHEVVVVGAAGNEDSMRRVYPAALSDAIAVSSIDVDYRKSVFSNFGPWVDVAAPGGGIDSTVPGGTYNSSGTSMAAPVVSGVLGLVLSIDKNRSYGSLRKAIVQNANGGGLYGKEVGEGFNYNHYYPKVNGESVRRPLLGAGVVDANTAITGGGTGKESGIVSRVNSGCGVVGLTGKKGHWLLLILLMIPLGVIRYRT
jgi:hypothetical protein